MYSPPPPVIALGAFCKTVKPTSRQQMLNELVDDLSKLYHLPPINYMTLGEAAAAKAGDRYLPPKDAKVLKDHIEALEKQYSKSDDESDDGPDEDHKNIHDNIANQKIVREDEKKKAADAGVSLYEDFSGPYINTHITPLTLYRRINALLASKKLPCLIKPRGNDEACMFNYEYLSYVAIHLDPANIMRVFWKVCSPLRPYIGFCEESYSLCKTACEDLAKTWGFDTTHPKTYNDVLAITKFAAIADRTFSPEVRARSSPEAFQLLCKLRISKLNRKIMTTVISHFDIYLGFCAKKKVKPANQQFYAARVILLLNLGYVIQVTDVPLRHPPLKKLFIYAELSGYPVVDKYLKVCVDLAHRKIINRSEVSEAGYGIAFMAAFNPLYEHLESKEGNVTTNMKDLRLDEIDACFESYELGKRNIGNPLLVPHIEDTPKQSPLKSSIISNSGTAQPVPLSQTTTPRTTQEPTRLTQSMMIETPK